MLEDLPTLDLVTEIEVEAALEQCNFKKGIGPDGFDGRIFEKDKAVKELIVKEITHIMNSGHIPEHLKRARLVPLTKIKGSSTASVHDIRPIMIKLHIFKVMEKAILIKIKSDKS